MWHLAIKWRMWLAANPQLSAYKRIFWSLQHLGFIVNVHNVAFQHHKPFPKKNICKFWLNATGPHNQHVVEYVQKTLVWVNSKFSCLFNRMFIKRGSCLVYDNLLLHLILKYFGFPCKVVWTMQGNQKHEILLQSWEMPLWYSGT